MNKYFKRGLPLWFTLLFTASTRAQHEPSSNGSGNQTLRVAVDLVLLDVRVTDDSGRVVKDLGKDAFKITAASAL